MVDELPHVGQRGRCRLLFEELPRVEMQAWLDNQEGIERRSCLLGDGLIHAALETTGGDRACMMGGFVERVKWG